MTEEDKREQVREELEKQDREAWQNSEYGKKGTTFFISYAKWKRLRCRMCRVKAEIHLMGPLGQYERLSLDSAHHPIGMDRETLDKYVTQWFVKKPFVTYWVASWNIRPA
jgi:hypothetical protein